MIARYLDLSTDHLTHTEMDDITAAPPVVIEHAHGAWVNVQPAEHGDVPLADDPDWVDFPRLAAVLEYARTLGDDVHWINFDADGEHLDDLPVFDRDVEERAAHVELLNKSALLDGYPLTVVDAAPEPPDPEPADRPWHVWVQREHGPTLVIGPYPDAEAAVAATTRSVLVRGFVEEDALDCWPSCAVPGDDVERVLIDPANPDHLGAPARLGYLSGPGAVPQYESHAVPDYPEP